MSTIYVSSTFADLRLHRQALSLAIRRLGHVDIAMEYYLAEDARPLDRCLRDAARCDLYVGLFARRYGFCPPGEQRSITELEFRAARAAGVDCLCFLLADDAPWPDAQVEQGAGAARLAALRAELGEAYLCGFFSTPDELAAIASAAIVRNLELDRAPFDAQREHRLMKAWRSTRSLPAERVRAAQALANMGSPRYVAAIKEQLLAADAQSDVAGIAHYLDQLQQLAASRRELMPIFLDLLEHEDAQRRYFAAFQLGELALRGAHLAPGIIDALLQRAGDPAPDVRAQVAHTLGKLAAGERGRADVRAVLEQLAQDPAPEVKERAEDSLSKDLPPGAPG
ncbi:MAG: DUF4062 domain-containing protein [Aquabacterium sp.]|nr:DUF4062 domain-containing protein [Aquabacterium sp.]